MKSGLSRQTRQALAGTQLTIYRGARRSEFMDGTQEKDVLDAIRAAASTENYQLANDWAAKYNIEICCRCAWLTSTWSVLLGDHHWVRVCARCALYVDATIFVSDADGAGARILERAQAEGLEDSLEDFEDEDE